MGFHYSIVRACADASKSLDAGRGMRGGGILASAENLRVYHRLVGSIIGAFGSPLAFAFA